MECTLPVYPEHPRKTIHESLPDVSSRSRTQLLTTVWDTLNSGTENLLLARHLILIDYSTEIDQLPILSICTEDCVLPWMVNLNPKYWH